MLIARNSTEEHAAVLDHETPVHASVGIISGVLGISVTTAILTSIGVEFAYLAAKNGPRRAAFDKVLPASSLANHAADVVSTVAGVYVGRWLARAARS